jgi:hypothetical protein
MRPVTAETTNRILLTKVRGLLRRARLEAIVAGAMSS